MVSQFKRQNLTVGLYHGRLNPLTRNWVLPNNLQVINLINMWLRGSTKEDAPLFKYLTKSNIEQVSNGNRNLSKTGQVMKVVDGFG